MNGSDARRLPHDWYDGIVPDNVHLADDAWMQTTRSLEMFRSRRDPGLILAAGSGAYDQTSFCVGPEGLVEIGEYACLNSANLICQQHIAIGRHCLLAWGTMVTDCWPNRPQPRRLGEHAIPGIPGGGVGDPRPVRIDDAAWIGFGSVILPGVTIGRGAVVGCRTIVDTDVPPYAVVAGQPMRVIGRLEADDTDAARTAALAAGLRR